MPLFKILVIWIIIKMVDSKNMNIKKVQEFLKKDFTIET